MALTLRLSGLTYSAIGKIMGLSHQRIQQMIRPPEPIYKMVRERADSRCQGCGLHLTSGHVHHKKNTGISREDFNDIKNLRYLCIGCHRTAHHHPRGKVLPINTAYADGDPSDMRDREILSRAAAIWGKKGGSVKSPRKARASRRNGKLAGSLPMQIQSSIKPA